MHSLKLNGAENRLNAASLIVRLVLRHDEVFRLPAVSRVIEVVAGTAWVSVKGRDIFLALGERLLLFLPPGRGADFSVEPHSLDFGGVWGYRSGNVGSLSVRPDDELAEESVIAIQKTHLRNLTTGRQHYVSLLFCLTQRLVGKAVGNMGQ